MAAVGRKGLCVDACLVLHPSLAPVLPPFMRDGNIWPQFSYLKGLLFFPFDFLGGAGCLLQEGGIGRVIGVFLATFFIVPLNYTWGLFVQTLTGPLSGNRTDQVLVYVKLVAAGWFFVILFTIQLHLPSRLCKLPELIQRIYGWFYRHPIERAIDTRQLTRLNNEQLKQAAAAVRHDPAIPGMSVRELEARRRKAEALARAASADADALEQMLRQRLARDERESTEE